MKGKKMFIKIVTAASLCLALILSTAACGGSSRPSDGTYVKPVEFPAGASTAETASQEASSGQPEMDQPETTIPAQSGNPDTEVISTGIAPGESGTTSMASPAEACFEEADLLFTYRERIISVGEAFQYKDFEDAWGTARIEKGQACIGGGFDENYYFGEDLTVFTLGDGGQQVIYDIYITEAGYATVKGAEIGKTLREELPLLYGPADSSIGATERYKLNGILVSFTFSGGILSEIDYNNTQN